MSTASVPKIENKPAGIVGWGPVLVVALLGLALFGKTLIDLMKDWWDNPDYSHGLLLPFALSYLLYEKRGVLRALPVNPSWLGLVTMVGALGINLVGYLGAEFFLQRFSFLVFAAGAVWFLFGMRHLWEMSFAFLLVLFAIPLPALVFNAVSLPLQLIASSWAEQFLRICSVPVFREGNILMLSYQTLNVAEACSGIRSLMSLITLGVMIAYFLPFKLWIRTMFVLTTIPIALVANAFRVGGTGLLGRWFGNAAAEGFFHTFSGWLVFVFALGVLVLEVLILQKWLMPQENKNA
jgi:exosortase